MPMVTEVPIALPDYHQPAQGPKWDYNKLAAAAQHGYGKNEFLADVQKMTMARDEELTGMQEDPLPDQHWW